MAFSCLSVILPLYCFTTSFIASPRALRLSLMFLAVSLDDRACSFTWSRIAAARSDTNAVCLVLPVILATDGAAFSFSPKNFLISLTASSLCISSASLYQFDFSRLFTAFAIALLSSLNLLNDLSCMSLASWIASSLDCF